MEALIVACGAGKLGQYLSILYTLKHSCKPTP
jgi:hypothetical protein